MGAVIALPRQRALVGAKPGTRANPNSRGLLEVPATAALLEHASFRDPMVDKIMLSRWGQPDDVAGAAVFLSSDDAEWITGIDLLVDGGTCAW
jgi:NAD(P)-dependent dehydrogenase (short-subunit alcohol dehydrogenase family)